MLPEISNSRLSSPELSALTKASESLAAYRKPRLRVRYWISSALITCYGAFWGYTALVQPLYFIELMLSQSIQPTELTTLLTVLRGLIILIITAFWLAGHFTKIEISKLAILLALLFTAAMSFFDFYTLANSGIYTSTLYNSLHVLIRPILFITLLTMFMDLRVYTREIRIHSQHSGDFS